jgi:hypothetical protein
MKFLASCILSLVLACFLSQGMAQGFPSGQDSIVATQQDMIIQSESNQAPILLAQQEEAAQSELTTKANLPYYIGQCPGMTQPTPGVPNDVADYVFNSVNGTNRAQDACFCSFSESWNGCLDNSICAAVYGNASGRSRFFNLTQGFNTPDIISNCRQSGTPDEIAACQIYFGNYSTAIRANNPLQVTYKGVTKTMPGGRANPSCDFSTPPTCPAGATCPCPPGKVCQA